VTLRRNLTSELNVASAAMIAGETSNLVASLTACRNFFQELRDAGAAPADELVLIAGKIRGWAVYGVGAAEKQGEDEDMASLAEIVADPCLAGMRGAA
jgi:hypothetical protein